MADNRKGKRWDDEEEKKLLHELSAGLPIYTIAKNHNRTEVGIGYRQKKIAVDLVAKGSSMVEVRAATKLTQDQIDEAMAEFGETQIEKEKKAKAKTEKKAIREQNRATYQNPQMTDLYRMMRQINKKLDDQQK